MNLFLNIGEYILLVESQWKNPNLLNSLSIQTNSNDMVELQTMNKNTENVSNFVKGSIYNHKLRND